MELHLTNGEIHGFWGDANELCITVLLQKPEFDSPTKELVPVLSRAEKLKRE
jgi:hypothetical protein